MKTVLYIASLFIIAGFPFLQGYPQNSRSMGNSDDTTRINKLNSVAGKFLKQSQYDSCLMLASQALAIAESLISSRTVINNPAYLKECKYHKIKSLIIIAECVSFSDPVKARDTLQTALKLVKETGNRNQEAAIYAGIGEIYSMLAHDQPGLVNNLRSLAILRETGNKKGLAWQLTNVGLNHRNMGNYGDAMEYFMESLKVSREISDSLTMIEALLAIGFTYAYVEKWNDALHYQKQAMKIYQQLKDSLGIARIYNDMGFTNMKAGNLDIALKQHQAALSIRLKSPEYYYTFASYLYIGNIYEKLNRLPEAIANYEAGLRYIKFSKYFVSGIDAHLNLGIVYLKSSDYQKAMKAFNSALELSLKIKDGTSEAQAYLYIAKVCLAQGEPLRALSWLRKAEKAAPESAIVFLGDTYQSIAETYFKLGDYKNAYINLKKYDGVKDSIIVAENLEKITTLSNRLEFENKQALESKNHEKILAINQAQIKREKITRNFSLFGMFVAFVLAVIVFVRFIEKKRLNSRLNETLSDLKSTQAQLIQSEKMASLGELTAGIAHEIQNPLNFVTNFSEVSQELVKEMNDELAIGNWQLAKEISEDIEQNLGKINHHGRRADAIVKGMLQHSRSSNGVKEPTDINALCDEYLRLAYHGLRAKDKSFNASMKTDFDETIGKIEIIPQDIGRVILNLITNAFYAVVEKREQAPPPFKGEIESRHIQYEPTVAVSTKLVISPPTVGGPRGVQITVSDNGNGIPPKVLDKIFQPFFTTKPTGEGTGLGLSLSYDIVKAHGGEIKVKTKENEGTEFTIALPM
ncbi:MAG: tetratricopeptide repeat protein [Bacteroidales bacterium]|nr:tetratricopeptide repeat protein [Bacteroidales bacterium]